MKRILFVDDETRILDGLRDLLRRHRRKWDMVFASGGETALEEIERAHFDVIVSDMRMPGIDGATLLRQVQEEHPGIVRIVLSGHTELESALRAVPVAHQFLTKPCNPAVLENVIERACNLQTLVGDDVVRRVVGKLEKLPSLPRVYTALTRALVDEQTGAADVARIIEQDMAMCAKVLQLVNSAFFGIGRRITNIEQAVTYLGFNMIKNLTLSVDVFEMGHYPTFAGFSIESVQRHSVLTASLATQILAEDKRQAEDAFMAGMLHDVGKLVLALELPDHVREIASRAREARQPVCRMEEEFAGVTHAEIGGYLLGLWGLPYPVVEAVANHHEPSRVPQRGLDVLAAVHISDALANEAAVPEDLAWSYAPVAAEYLESFGLTEKIGSWRKLAGEASEAQVKGE